MSDNKEKRNPQDAQRLNINESSEVSYWTKLLKISRTELERIVKEVGPLMSDVRKELSKA